MKLRYWHSKASPAFLLNAVGVRPEPPRPPPETSSGPTCAPALRTTVYCGDERLCVGPPAAAGFWPGDPASKVLVGLAAALATGFRAVATHAAASVPSGLAEFGSTPWGHGAGAAPPPAADRPLPRGRMPPQAGYLQRLKPRYSASCCSSAAPWW